MAAVQSEPWLWALITNNNNHHLSVDLMVFEEQNRISYFFALNLLFFLGSLVCQ
jgi:hypothetical protein